MEPRIFGYMPNGGAVHQYTLKNSALEVKILDLGGTITNLFFDGSDIVCGFESVEDILLDDSYQGAIIGRCANRIKNSTFDLNGVRYDLSKNVGNHHLHGGAEGFNRRIWSVLEYSDTHIALSLHSPNGDQGYPGNLTALVTYSIHGSSLKIEYEAHSDMDTVVNLTNHAYFNLCGYDAGSILSHRLRINADYISEMDESLLVTGRELPVEGTVYDLREPIEIGRHMANGFGGYDNNFILNTDIKQRVLGSDLTFAAEVDNGERGMRVYTDRDCMQLYIGVSLTGEPAFKGGYRKSPFTTYCFETQCSPNAPNLGKGILRANDTYRTKTVYELFKI